jgi:hypothetical protein
MSMTPSGIVPATLSEWLRQVPLNYLKGHAVGTERSAPSLRLAPPWWELSIWEGIIRLRAVATGRETFQKNVHWPGYRALLAGLSTSNRSPFYGTTDWLSRTGNVVELHMFRIPSAWSRTWYEITLPTHRIYQKWVRVCPKYVFLYW